MKIILANDHGAIELKQKIQNYLEGLGHTITNLGVDQAESVDYPDQAEMACTEFKKGGYDFGILFCGTGIGISIAANKISGIRAALPQNKFAARMAKEHNNANFLAFGGRIEYGEPVEEMIAEFIKTKYEGGRHDRRVNKMMDLEG